mmetsp:Transcript_15187/g.32955  ORF Transcript_15187/g.32955 Transcript_15187/m.32955 type:complete len:526 (-) Transcript_15187:286-1863(-)
MTYDMAKICTAIAALLSLLTVVHVTANEEYLCSVGPDGQEDCQAVYFEPELDDASPDDEEEAEANWRSGLAVEECTDHDAECNTLAESGECENNPGYMKYECAVSCGACEEFDAAYEALRDGTGDGPCTDKYRECKNWGAMGECGFNPKFMLVQCERSCMICYEDTNQFGVHQEVTNEGDENYAETTEVIKKSIDYMKKLWSPNPENNRINYKCRNMDKLCSFWAGNGECVDDDDDNENNAEWMNSNCAPACQTCHLLDSQLRCPIEEGNELAMEPGGLNTLMEIIVDNADGSGDYQKYNPKALSRPKVKADGTAAPGVEKDGPWIVVLENFISDEEADVLIAAGYKKGYQRSSDVGIENPDGTHEEEVSDGRTSTNAWCDEEMCDKDPVIGQVVDRIAHATKTEVGNSEHLQLLRYEPGQYYKKHHDYIEYQQDLPSGVRMLTLFLYLNDVEEGGGTGFPLLDITVQPKKGSALLWPSVLDQSPEDKDWRTDHEALPVIKGIKYGANAWIHTRDYRKAEKNDCA